MSGDRQVKQVIPFEPAHVLEIVESPNSILQVFNLASTFHAQGPAFTGVVNGVMVGCAGVACYGHIGEAWMLLNSAAQPHALWLMRTVRGYLADIKRNMHLHRIQSVVRTDAPQHVRVIELLGFVYEGTLLNYGGPGVAYHMYRYSRQE